MKVVAKAALIVGAVAAVATGVGAIVGATAFASLGLGVSLATISAIGTVAGLVGTVAQSLSKPKAGSVSGSLTDFKLDPAATIPIMFGRTYNGGNVVHRDTWGTDNQYQGFVVVYSGCGPIGSIEQFQADRTTIPFDGNGAAAGGGFGPGGKGPWMWFGSQIGQTPEPAALASPVAGFPGWTAAHKLSGYAAGILVLKFDKDGKKYQGGVPKTGIVGEGVRAWDPRLDSTYPGGNGPSRRDNPATWTPTRNPWLIALQFAFGWWENGYLVGGVGAPGTSVIVSDYVAAANVADANGWEASGVRATGDPKWDTLKLLCEAGGGEPVWLGAALSCMVSTPRVSVATITTDDLRGPISIVGTQTRRGGRVNTGIPVFRSEAHGWEEIPASAITVATYVAEDGGTRTKEIPFRLVANLDQAAQLTAYSLVNGREFGPIETKLDPRWIGLAPGMAVDLDVPEAGLFGQQAIVIARSIEPATGLISVTFKSETAAKHAFALGASAVAPPTPSLGAPDYATAAVNYETAGQAATYIRNSAARNVSLSAADAGDGTATISISAHVRDYPDRDLAIPAATLTGAPLDTSAVLVYYDDVGRSDTTPDYHWTLDYEEAVNSVTYPYRHYVGLVPTPAAGGQPTDGDPPPYPGGGGYCVHEDTMILLEDGAWIRAAELRPGMLVRTLREDDLAEGVWPVSAVKVVPCSDAWRYSNPDAIVAEGAVAALVGSGGHRVWADGDWRRLDQVGVRSEACNVVAISVPGARTYVSNGLLSHNIKMAEPNVPNAE